MAFDGTLQVSRSESRIGAFLEQEITGARCAAEYELPACRRRHDPLLHVLQLDIQNLLQVLALQRPEHNYLVNAIHELWRVLRPRRIDRHPVALLVELDILLAWPGGVAEAAAH